MRGKAGGVPAAILLAAGLSTRMGRPKPLLPWDGRPLVRFQVEQLLAAGIEDVVVVTGHEAEAVQAALHDVAVRVAYNPEYAAGRAGSVRTGASAVRGDAPFVVILNVDQPRPAELIGALVCGHVASGAAITVPVFEGRRGHPAIFAGALLPELRAVAEETEGLRAVMRRHAADVHEAPVSDPRALLDTNTPEAYQAARRAFSLPDVG
jgi:molybdenum cofactor cytidylyltransferase